jgi:hypothetical protein
MLQNAITILALALANGAIALTVTKSKFFAWLRAWLSIQTSRPGKFAYGLLSCPYCFSHWLGIVAVIVWRPRLTFVPDYGVSYLWIADYVVTTFVVIALSALVAGCIFRLFKDSPP